MSPSDDMVEQLGGNNMDRKGVVAEFLVNCIKYANDSIERKRSRGELELISAWETYIQFTQHALDEVHTGKLDSWFETEGRKDLTNAKRIDIMGVLGYLLSQSNQLLAGCLASHVELQYRSCACLVECLGILFACSY